MSIKKVNAGHLSPFIFFVFPSLSLKAKMFRVAQGIFGFLKGLIFLVGLRANFYFSRQQSHMGYQIPVLGHPLCPPACASPVPALCHC